VERSVTEAYHIDFEDVKEWIKDHGFKHILIQAPPGLRKLTFELSEEITPLVDLVTIHGGSCWGGCDVAYKHAELIGADAIIHLGHSKFLSRDPLPTYYLECRYRNPLSLFKALEDILPRLRDFRRIGIGVTIQWQDFLEELRERIQKIGLEVLVGSPDPPLRYDGQILGCSYNTLFKISDRADCFLIIGSKFHGLGLALQTEKKVYVIDPEIGRAEDLVQEAEKLLKMRYAYIERFRESRRIGVVVSIKPGQYRLGLALKLKKILRESGKRAEILLMDDILPDQLMESAFDAFVNTACPRISIEDQYKINKPILLPAETLISLGKLGWEETIKTPKYMLMEVI